MSDARKYEARGVEAEFEPGSRSRVLRSLLGITRVRDMNEAESQALLLAQEAALDRFGPDYRFKAADICELHRMWLGKRRVIIRSVSEYPIRAYLCPIWA